MRAPPRALPPARADLPNARSPQARLRPSTNRERGEDGDEPCRQPPDVPASPGRHNFLAGAITQARSRVQRLRGAAGERLHCTTITSHCRPQMLYDAVRIHLPGRKGFEIWPRLTCKSAGGGEARENGDDADVGSGGVLGARGFVAGAAGGGARPARRRDRRRGARRHHRRRAGPRPAARLRAPRSAPRPARSSPRKRSGGRAAITGGGAVATTAIRTAPGCRCSRAIAPTESRPAVDRRGRRPSR